MSCVSPCEERIIAKRWLVRKGARAGNTHLWTIRASIARNVPHDLCEIFRILDDKYVPEHLEVIEIRGDAGYLE